MIIQTPKRRRYVYDVLLATSPLVLFYGLATAEEIALWLAWLQTVLGLGLARFNVNE